jgi:CDP-diglyceride synthetase
VVAAASGLVVGIAMVGMVALGTVGCDAVRGTPSCGGPGLLILIATVALAVLGGCFLLRFGQVRDSGTVSFLAVMCVASVVLLFLIDLTYSPWIWLILPVISAAAFPVAAYVVGRSRGIGGRSG